MEDGLQTLFIDALDLVIDTARSRGLDLRTAALMVAVARVAEAARMPGVYP